MRSCSMTWLYCFLCIAWSLYEVYVINHVIFLYNFCQLSRGGKKTERPLGQPLHGTVSHISYCLSACTVWELQVSGSLTGQFGADNARHFFIDESAEGFVVFIGF